MNLTYNVDFLDDLREITRYYKKININCKKIIFDIFKSIGFLKIFPKMGTPYENNFIEYDFRYIIAGRYVIFYKIDETVRITRVLHGKRNIEMILFEDLISI